MNRLKTTDNGGFPLELDDLRWQEEAVRDAFKGLTSFLERDNIILSGVAISGLGTATTTWTEGYVLINGEVCKVDAPTVPLNTVNQAFSTYIEVIVEYDANGLETFENNVAYDTYEKRKATITTYATAQPGKTHYIGFGTVKDVINTFILNYPHRFTACQSWAQGDSVAAYSNQNLIPVDNGSGNVFNVNIDNAVQTMVGTMTTFPDGTWIAFRFTGNANSQIKIGDNNTEFKTPNGRTFIFRTGETALFIAVDGKLCLVNEPYTLHVDGSIRLRKKIIPIGDWNMDTDGEKHIAHGLDFTKIRTVSATIRNDANDKYFPINYVENGLGGLNGTGGVNSWNSTEIELQRNYSGVYDNDKFDATSYNRGWLTIEYEE